MSDSSLRCEEETHKYMASGGLCPIAVTGFQQGCVCVIATVRETLVKGQ